MKVSIFVFLDSYTCEKKQMNANSKKDFFSRLLPFLSSLEKGRVCFQALLDCA